VYFFKGFGREIGVEWGLKLDNFARSLVTVVRNWGNCDIESGFCAKIDVAS
jgi:hypothetical protein